MKIYGMKGIRVLAIMATLVATADAQQASDSRITAGRENTVKLSPEEVKALNAKRELLENFKKQLDRGEITLPPLPQKKKLTVQDFPPGQFQNLENIRLEWISPDYFLFIPKLNNPFRFVRADGTTVEPRTFFTDGASVPRIFRWNSNLDQFGLLPAALLHDWQFERHHCGQLPDDAFADVNNMLMEAINTMFRDGLATPDPFAFWGIYWGVSSPIAYGIWSQQPPTCPPPDRPE
jgi:Protein of unknown function (DUF1353)